ncbi:hypothetical protein FB446DRAFT_792698 [Lentinula raphanica]|nr:hypothetical protein FB446DRAFT_792698 [Lentinula raphanica]
MLRRSQRVKDKENASGETQPQEETSATSNSSSIATFKDARNDEGDNKEFAEEDIGDEYKGEEDLDDIPKKKRSKKTAATKQVRASRISIQFSDMSGISTRRQRVPEQFRRVRGRLGLLEKVAKEMPLDVILEIFCHLEPRDLLRLARTTRDLRGILMSKTREFIWRIARGNVEGLPPRPADLNEPQYADLLFESYCHVCMGSGRCDILWNFRMRSCQKCLRTFPVLQGDEIDGDHPLDAYYGSILPTEFRTPYSSKRISYPKIVQRYKTEYDALETQEDRDAWIIWKRDERRVITAHNDLCKEWYRTCIQRNRIAQRDALRKIRKEAILDRLEEIGWREEAEIILRQTPYNFDSFSSLKAVKTTKKLNEKGWDCIKDGLVEFLSEHKERRLFQERRHLLYSRVALTADIYDDIFSRFDLREPQPTIGDVLSNEVFKSFIEDLPKDEDFTEDVVRSKLLEHLPEFLKEWRAAKNQNLVEIMQRFRPTATVSDLHLATTFFECRECRGHALYYPHVFYHKCCTKRRPAPLESLVNYVPLKMDHPGQWSPLSIEFSDACSDYAKALLQKCSLDPNNAAFQDIYPLFECTTCERDPLHQHGGRYFMRWPLPLVHNRNHTLIAVDSLNQEEQNAILACEPSINSDWYNPVCCAHCHDLPEISDFVEHLKNEHKDVVDIPQSENPPKVQTLREHWYWNPHLQLHGLGYPFRYKEGSTVDTIGRSDIDEMYAY